MVVWYQTDGAYHHIWANRFDGFSWGTAVSIENGPGSGYGPQLDFDPNGNAIVVWYQANGTNYDIMANKFNGSSWSTAELIGSGITWAMAPQIACDFNENAIALWYQPDAIYNSIWANRYDGSSWHTAELFETEDFGHAQDPRIEFDSNGNGIAVWVQSNGINYGIRAKYYDGLSWSNTELIGFEDTDDDAYSPKIYFGSGGSAIAIWYQTDGTLSHIWANHFNNSSWGTAEMITIEGAAGAHSQQIAIDTEGNAIAIWEEYDGTHRNILVSHYN